MALSLGAVMALLYFPLRLLLLQREVELERQLVAINVGRAVDALDANLDSLSLGAVSYATWDETYQFALGAAPSYPEVNQPNEAFVAEERDLVVIVGADGSLRLLKAVDRHSGATVEPPALPLDADSPLLSHSEGDVRNGLLVVEGQPLLLAMAPILRSDQSGPSAGTLILGRWLDAQVLGALRRTTNLDLAFFSADDSSLPAGLIADLAAQGDDLPVLVQPLNEDEVVGFALVRDLRGQPELVGRIVESRDIVQQGRSAAGLIAVALLVAGLTVGGAIMLLLERALLSRIGRLSAEVEAVARDGDPVARVTVDRNDELTQLATGINSMLAALDQVQHERRAVIEAQLRLQEQADQTRRQLLSRVSHELRTPLTPIRGYADILLLKREHALDPDTRELVKIIQTNTDRMVVLIEDLLDLGRADAEQLRLQITRVSLPGVIHEALDMLHSEFEKKALQIKVDPGDSLPLVEADARRLGQVLTNLLSNALKYTHPGGSVEVCAGHGAAGYVQIKVSDTGVGMSPDQLRQLFTPFFRGDSPLHTSNNGVGLGLLIARTLVQLHHGDLSVSSQPGAGSCFTVTLPITQLPSQAEPAGT